MVREPEVDPAPRPSGSGTLWQAADLGATRGASPDRYDAAAYDLYVARGAQRLPTVGSLSSVAAAIGASRSQLYRHWETAADLDRDVTAHLATQRLGWMHHLDLDPEEPFGRAIARLLSGPGLCSGAAIWPAIAAEPAGSPLRHHVAAFERRYLHRLAAHLERTCPVAVDHDVPWTDLAVAVASLLHGAACSWAVLRSAPGDPVDDELQDLLVDIVTDLHVRFPQQVRGADVPLADDHAPPAGTRPEGAVRLLDRIADAVEAAEVGMDPGERRLVSVDDLARSLEVTPRHLFERWPSAVDMNLAVATEGFARLLEGFDRLTQHLVETLADADAQGPGEGALVEHQARQVDPDVYPEAHQLLAIVAAAADPSLARPPRPCSGRCCSTWHRGRPPPRCSSPAGACEPGARCSSSPRRAASRTSAAGWSWACTPRSSSDGSPTPARCCRPSA